MTEPKKKVSKPEFIWSLDARRVMNPEELGCVQGLNTVPYDKFLADIEKHSSARRREELEKDPSQMHPLPYLVVYKGSDEDDTMQMLTYQRTKLVGEERLAGKMSVGLGGHVELIDDTASCDGEIDIATTYLNNIQRELNEEAVFIKDGKHYAAEVPGATVSAEALGDFAGTVEVLPIYNSLIVDCDDEKVGRYHTGILFFIKVPEGFDVKIREGSEHIDCGFQDRANLIAKVAAHREANNGEQLVENWTRMVLFNEYADDYIDVRRFTGEMVAVAAADGEDAQEVREVVADQKPAMSFILDVAAEAGASDETLAELQGILASMSLAGLRYRAQAIERGENVLFIGADGSVKARTFPTFAAVPYFSLQDYIKNPPTDVDPGDMSLPSMILQSLNEAKESEAAAYAASKVEASEETGAAG